LSFSNGEVQASAAGGMRALTDYKIDDRGQVYRTQQFGVNPSNGSVAGSLVTNLYRDGRGLVTKEVDPGGLVTETQHDGAGRVIGVYQGDGSTTVHQVNPEYDADGNVVLTTTRDALPGGPYRVSYVRSYYDAGNRLTATADFGTDGTTATANANAAPTRSDTTLVNSYTYDSAGRNYTVTDPRGIVTKTEYDPLGRVFRRTEAYVDGAASPGDDRITSYEYTPLDQVSSVTAYNAKPGATSAVAQTTTYLYGTGNGTSGSTLASNDVLGKILYPDGSTESYAYNALGEQTKKIGRNSVTHAYAYDAAGRLRSDLATTIPSDVDNTVQKLTDRCIKKFK
jgi:YD repeat-containing protein